LADEVRTNVEVVALTYIVEDVRLALHQPSLTLANRACA
jgi:hypothetical protein